MQIINTAEDFQKIRKIIKASIGFVPTMGNLHEGHESLIIKSKRENEISVVSVFVNPTQFNDSRDYVNYTRTPEQDTQLAEKLGVNYLFFPQEKNLYSDKYNFKVTESTVSTVLEGAHRPGHFDGMLTVVLKLLCIICPTRCYFGEKDYQQYRLVKSMVEAFFLETEIVACRTIRNSKGLPLSSRNNRLSPKQFEKAQLFPHILHANRTTDDIKTTLISQGFEVDYVEDYEDRRFAAVRLGDIRLIDNIILEAL